MEKLLVKGKKILSGVIQISGSKNATLPILAPVPAAPSSRGQPGKQPGPVRCHLFPLR